MNDYISKPIDVKQLHKSILAWTSKESTVGLDGTSSSIRELKDLLHTGLAKQ